MNALIGIDLNDPDAPDNLAHAARICQQLNCTLDLLFVDAPPYPLGLVTDPGAIAALEAETERLRQSRQFVLDDLERSLHPSVRGEALYRGDGDPAEQLCALGLGRDLVFVGTHGRRGLQRLLLGSVAEKVVRRSAVPVWTLRPTHTRPISRILLAIDLSEKWLSERVTAAATIASRLNARLDLVYVGATFGTDWLDDPTVRDLMVREGLRLEVRDEGSLTELAAGIPEAVRGQVHRHSGDPAGVVVSLAGEYDLLICSTHGRTGLGHLLMGSVAERIVRTATVPLLILPHAG